MSTRKGIILAGGKGSRLYPITYAASKQLLPVYDKPMIYYPLSTLMLGGIRDFLIITTSKDNKAFVDVLGSGEKWGLNFQYAIQNEPKGIAESFIVGEKFIGHDLPVLILGDNIFYGHNMVDSLSSASVRTSGATIFGYEVSDPGRYGVVEFDESEKIISIDEKPASPKSNYAVTGLYYYDEDIVEIAKSIKPSKRNELEITDINKHYLEKEKLNVELLGRGTVWLDTGTPDSMVDATEFVRVMEKRQGVKICCPEEIARQKGYINDEQLLRLAHELNSSEYGEYLRKLVDK